MLTQMGIATVRTRLPFPSRSARTLSSLALLDGLNVELGQLVPPEGAANQQRQDHVVAFALQSRAVGDSQQLFGLLASQPVSQPGSLLADVGDVGRAGLLLSELFGFWLTFGEEGGCGCECVGRRGSQSE
jgi:hypothetical protein